MIETLFTLVDVFAARPLEGNLLAVIEDADPIDDATMATLADAPKRPMRACTLSGSCWRSRCW